MTPEAALELAYDWSRRGIPAFPIAISWDDEKHATNKRPLCAHGHRDAEADRGTVLRLFQDAYSLQPGEELGVGLWPGPANRVVLDVDDKGGLRGSDELDALEAEHGRLPDHPVVPTPSGGTHRWFAKPPGVHVGNADLAPGINVRADEGWVVAPGTITTWGAWEVEEATLGPAPLWPAWLAAKLTGSNQANGQARGRWQPLDRDALDPRDLAALEALEALGGHDPYLGSDGSVLVTRPGKRAGASASIGFVGPGIVKVFTDSWPRLENRVYDADELTALAATGKRAAPPLSRPANTYRARRALFTFDGRIQLNACNLLVGIGGLNKSTLTIRLAADASRGKLDGDLKGEAFNVLLASAEDGTEDVVVPRLIAERADMGRVHILSAPLVLPGDAARLIEEVRARDVKLLIIDPVVCFLADDVNSHRDSDVRRALLTLRQLGEDHGVTSQAVVHLNKTRAQDIYTRISGSVGYFNAARSVLAMTADPENPDDLLARILWHEKCNAGPRSRPQAVEVVSTSIEDPDGGEDISTIKLKLGVWLDGKTIADALGGDDGGTHANRSAHKDAEAWLRAALEDGPVSVKDLKKESAEAGISWGTLSRARVAIGALSRRRGFGLGAEWYLPSADPGDPAQEPRSGNAGSQERAHSAQDPHSAHMYASEPNGPAEPNGGPETAQSRKTEEQGSHSRPPGFGPEPGDFEQWTHDPTGGPCVKCGHPTNGRDPAGDLRHRLGCPL